MGFETPIVVAALAAVATLGAGPNSLAGPRALSPPSGIEQPAPRGQWQWPLKPTPTVVRAFDPPDQPWLAGHRGVDLLAAPGAAVHAPADGTLTFAGAIAGRGVVVVSHGPLRSTFEPVHTELAVGSTVTAGQSIGSLATSGGHCAPRLCLHWGVLRGQTYLDPLTLVGQGPIILLPLADRGEQR